MIELNRLNGKAFIVNCEMIMYLEKTPDTIVTLSDGQKMMVKQSVDEVISLTIDYRKRLYQEPIEKK